MPYHRKLFAFWKLSSLIYFMQLVSFCTLWKYEKNSFFFSGGIGRPVAWNKLIFWKKDWYQKSKCSHQLIFEIILFMQNLLTRKLKKNFQYTMQSVSENGFSLNHIFLWKNRICETGKNPYFGIFYAVLLWCEACFSAKNVNQE